MVEKQDLTLDGMTYTICSDGTVIGPSGKIIKQKLSKDGYPYFRYGKHKRNMFTHRAVAICFVPNPEPGIRVEIDHKDGHRDNPSKDNLEWVTHAENIRRAAARGSYSGERNSHAKLNKYEAFFIKVAKKKGMSRQWLALNFGLVDEYVSQLAKGLTWKMLPDVD